MLISFPYMIRGLFAHSAAHDEHLLAGADEEALQALGSSQPVLYVEFRKDGTPVDPGPWWANDSEKVRG